ncbi:uncharacterized protein LOC116000909 [Ipomoea triloba]|uniref:uncharacterized protein LOC116000909 n=1 Tax=Ipomoea triloba TaxID=35885 RepID=UPI00125D5917|nr:uncharacterized protein LOC116000909 [Ipomoea triloba]
MLMLSMAERGGSRPGKRAGGSNGAKRHSDALVVGCSSHISNEDDNFVDGLGDPMCDAPDTELTTEELRRCLLCLPPKIVGFVHYIDITILILLSFPMAVP